MRIYFEHKRLFVSKLFFRISFAYGTLQGQIQRRLLFKMSNAVMLVLTNKLQNLAECIRE